MDETQPTQPLPPQEPQAAPQQPTQQYPAQQPQRPAAEPFYKRHGLAFAISTLVLAVLLLFGMIGVGAYAVGSVVFHAGSPVSRLLHEDGRGGPVPVKPQIPGQEQDQGRNGGTGGGQDGQGRGSTAQGVLRGTVTKIDGSTWTITTQRGVTLTVDITSSTVFGAPGQSEKASDFATGDDIIVVGPRSGDTVTATRVVKISDLPLRPPSHPGSTATPSPTPGS